MNPEEETRFAEAFTEFGKAAELMIEPSEASAIHGRVRRRRATRVAVAGIAALALAVPTGWALQQAATAEERDVPIADEPSEWPSEYAVTHEIEEPSPSEEASPQGDEESLETGPLPTFDDLVGTTLDLPSFMPGHDLVDQACPVGGATLEDGTTGGYMQGGGRIGLLEVLHVPMTEAGGRELPVLFLGCRFAEAAAYQAVVLDQSEGTGEWYVGAQLITSESNADSPYDIAATPPGVGYGVLIGVAERYACCGTDPDELDHWVEQVTLDDQFAPVRHRFEDGGIPDLSLQVSATEEEAGVWTVSALIVNEGGAASGDYFLSACADPGEIQAEFTVQDCDEAGMKPVATIGSLEPGEEHSLSWEVTVAPAGEWTDGAYIWFEIAPDTFTAEGIARDLVVADNDAFFEFTE
jgi:hypothetical protein